MIDYAVLDFMPVGIIVLRHDLEVLFWNSCLEFWTGIPRRAIVGHKISEHFPHFTKPLYTSRLKQVFEDGSSSVFSAQLHQHIIPARLPNGTLRVQHTTVTALEGASLPFFDALISVQDVTELSQRVQDYREEHQRLQDEIGIREEAEKALRESEEKFRLTYENSYAGIVLADVQGNVLKANPTYCRMLGYQEAELINVNFRKFTTPASLEDELPLVQKLLAQEIEHYRMEKQYITKSGELIWVDLTVSVNRGASHDPLNFIAIVEDITERKRAEEALRKSEANLRTILDSSNQLFVLLNTDGHMVYVGTAAQEIAQNLLGSTVELGGLAKDYVPQQWQEIYDTLFNRALRGRLAAFEAANPFPDGTQHYLEIIFYPIVDSREQVIGVCINGRDITQRKYADHQRLELALERERTKILTSFIEDAAHEFRTPLSIINSSAYLMDKNTDPAKRARSLQDINHQVNVVAGLVSSMLTVTRLDGDERATREAIDLNQLVRLVHVELNDEIAAKSLEIRLLLQEGLPVFYADANQVQLAIRCLFENAIHFNYPDGAITVLTRSEANAIILEVHDTGVGISEEAMPHIFELFFREDKARTRRGFGLGLSIAKKVIEKYNGTISVESHVGRGSKFKITLLSLR